MNVIPCGLTKRSYYVATEFGLLLLLLLLFPLDFVQNKKGRNIVVLRTCLSIVSRKQLL